MSTLDELRTVMARIARCDGSEITRDTALKDVKADSLHWLQIIIRIEGDYDIEVDFDKMRDMTTIGDFVDFIDASRA